LPVDIGTKAISLAAEKYKVFGHRSARGASGERLEIVVHPVHGAVRFLQASRKAAAIEKATVFRGYYSLPLETNWEGYLNVAMQTAALEIISLPK
jgi:hypothetical protein